jgi:PAS domain S-box-containing protein
VLLTRLEVGAAEPSAFKRALMLQETRLGDPGSARFDAAFVEALQGDDSVPIEVTKETIERLEFPGAEQFFTDYMKHKYAERKVDAMVVVGTLALSFARRNREIFGNPPIVAAVSPVGEIDRNSDTTGLQAGPVVWIDRMISLARALRPDTSSVVVVDGARGNTGDLEAEIKRHWKEQGDGMNLTYLRDLPLGDLLSRVAGIPEHSIVLFARQTLRDQSQDVDQFEALARVVSASPVPVFSMIEDFVGRGILGGHVWRFEANAKRMADMTKLIVNGTRTRDVPVGRATYSDVLDWRQLQRWHIPDSRVPAGTLVLFRPQSFFQLYRHYVVGGLLIFAAQMALIVGLLVQRIRRQRAEEESRKSEERYRSVVDMQSDLICRFLPDSTLTFVNDAYCRFWNKTRSELLGRKFIELIPQLARHAVLERIGRLRSGLDSHEHPVMLPDGSIGWHHWINHAIVDERGRLLEFQGVGRDITDRKRAEDALLQMEARNSAILRAIPDLMFMLRRDGTYLDYHARDPKLLFVPPDQFIGRTIQDVMPPHLAAPLMDALERACKTDDPIVVEYELPMNEPRYFEARLVSAGNDRVLTIVRDVTESKRAAHLNRDLAGRLIAAQEAERARIARDLHDDVCQEVAAVSVDISHLKRQTGDVRHREIQEMLVSLQRRTAAVAESLRLLSHGLHPAVLHHIGLVAALQAHCAEVERQHHMLVNFSADGNVEPANPLVALSLYRIAQEALGNTARHGHARHATVSLARSDSEFTLAIADDGDGFDVVAARQNGGLGLVSIEERARLVHGQVTIRSEPRHETAVEVHVPLEIFDALDAGELGEQLAFAREGV